MVMVCEHNLSRLRLFPLILSADMEKCFISSVHVPTDLDACVIQFCVFMYLWGGGEGSEVIRSSWLQLGPPSSAHLQRLLVEKRVGILVHLEVVSLISLSLSVSLFFYLFYFKADYS